jgi:hypothetical protein
MISGNQPPHDVISTNGRDPSASSLLHLAFGEPTKSGGVGFLLTSFVEMTRDKAAASDDLFTDLFS